MKGLLNKFKEMSTKGKIATIVGILFIIGIFGNLGEEKNTTETSTVKQEETVKEEKYTTKYLTEDGKQAVKNFKENKSDYQEVTVIGLGGPEKDSLVKMTIVVDDVDIDENNIEIDIDYDKTNNIQWSTSDFTRIIFPSFAVDTEFKKGDTITIYGRYNDLLSKTFENGTTSYYYHIGGHFIEKSNGTNE